ncbi:MAG: hypothetical protein IJ870_02935 [Alphaproteobacteria bacterium]|nr:hypothetical protein [Alphaproteobacteria bacterium]
MAKELELTVLEKSAMLKGLATRTVRLKAGRIIFDEMEPELSQIRQTAERIEMFRQKVGQIRFYEKLALKDWLRAQIDGEADLLGNAEQSTQIARYCEYLKAISASEE